MDARHNVSGFMPFSLSQLAIIFIAALHLLFAAGELFPLSSPPLILDKLLKKKPGLGFGEEELRLASRIVNNAGVYNTIVAAGLMATVWAGAAAKSTQIVLLLGGIVAGVFGAFTLSKGVWIQALLGATALLIVSLSN